MVPSGGTLVSGDGSPSCPPLHARQDWSMTQSLGEEENLSQGAPGSHVYVWKGVDVGWQGSCGPSKKTPSRLPETQENRGTVQQRLQLEDLGVPNRS